MGRNWKRNKKNKHAGHGKPRQSASPKEGSQRDPYALISGGNYKMESYYAYQGIHSEYLDPQSKTFKKCESLLETEEERIRWMNSMTSILPASFRIGNDVDIGLRRRLQRELEEYVGKKMELEILPKGGGRLCEELDLKPEMKLVAPAMQIPFVPYAYQLSVDRQTIRRNPQLNPFHEWLKIQTEAGFVTRQETVSMIPPVILAPERHHIVLDMCAAPGSKTSQLLELLNLPVHPKDTEPTGCVVANDADSKRAYMLVHQLRRINSPAVFVTSCDAQFFPMMKSAEKAAEGMFDRVLCDVPCSGDGTSRKNPGIWKKWNAINAYGLHALQLSISLKGARLTKVGGYLCYSTCSINPIENEAVVAELLRASEGSLVLVDKRIEHAGLLARDGMCRWKVLSESKSMRQVKNKMKKNNDKMKARRMAWDKNNIEKDAEGESLYDNEEEVLEDYKMESNTAEIVNDDASKSRLIPIKTKFQPETMAEEELKKMAAMAGLNEYRSFEDVPQSMKKRIRKSCFPPTEEEIGKFNLKYCMRILPQDMDTGGFFVALLRKVAPMSPRARSRFQKLELELQEAADVDVDGERETKRIKTEVPSDDEVVMSDSRPLSADTVDCVDGDKDGDVVVRGHLKKNYLEDNDGKKHTTLGRDDFIPVPIEVFESLKDYYGLSSKSFNESQFMTRACGDTKVLYFITKTVRKLIAQGLQERVTVVTSGLKGFVRNNKDCEVPYRLSQEGVHFVVPHMTKRKIGVELDDFEKCLDAKTIQLDLFSTEFGKEARSLSMGSFVVYLKGFEDDYIKKFMVVMWRCRGDALNCLVNKAELDGMKSKVRSVMGKE